MTNEKKERLKGVVREWADDYIFSRDASEMSFIDERQQHKVDEQTIFSLIDRVPSEEEAKNASGWLDKITAFCGDCYNCSHRDEGCESAQRLIRKALGKRERSEGMNKEIKEALERMEKRATNTLRKNFTARHLWVYRNHRREQCRYALAEIRTIRTLRTALEAYKPKTVPREFLDNALDLVSGCAAFGGGVHLDAFEEGLISLLENEDIEVEGDK